MLPECSQDYSVQLENAIRDLGDLEDDLGTDLFFMYCSQDFECDTHLDLTSFKTELEQHGYKW